MAERMMTYDFMTALKDLKNCHIDLVEIITKWGQMLDPVPRYVDFKLQNGVDTNFTELSVPNVAMITQSIDERALPPNPSFRTVSATGSGGIAVLTNGSLNINGELDTGAVGGTYDYNGTENIALDVDADIAVTEWPIPRYWNVKQGGPYTANILPSDWGNNSKMHGCDFFVRVAEGTSISLEFINPNLPQTINLASGNTPSVWHVVDFMSIVRSGSAITGYRQVAFATKFTET